MGGRACYLFGCRCALEMAKALILCVRGGDFSEGGIYYRLNNQDARGLAISGEPFSINMLFHTL